MTTDGLNSALNECVEEALALGDIQTAQAICDAHPGEIAPDLFWTVEVEVANLQDEIVEDTEPAPVAVPTKPLHELFDLTDLDDSAEAA